ncbi:MAG TPA: YqiJ family protein [Novosphingobium sp.]|nr:YqiJ family protein [Novosphingobium sp.]HQA18943.1 YqiJ family protein [Novosphingobium sp.]
MSALLAPENLPFAVSLALLGLLVIVQAVGLGHFFPDPDFDIDGADGDLDLGDGLASLLGFGQVPLMVWLASMLACFGLLGLSLQNLFAGIFGSPFPAPAASGAALLVAIPANSAFTRLLGRVWPKDETTAIPIDGLLGRRGTIAVGRASRGNPARATVHDIHGQLHNVMVEPHEDQTSFGEGDEVLLVRREGEIFYALDGQGPIRLLN